MAEEAEMKPLGDNPFASIYDRHFGYDPGSVGGIADDGLDFASEDIGAIDSQGSQPERPTQADMPTVDYGFEPQVGDIDDPGYGFEPQVGDVGENEEALQPPRSDIPDLDYGFSGNVSDIEDTSIDTSAMASQVGGQDGDANSFGFEPTTIEDSQYGGLDHGATDVPELSYPDVSTRDRNSIPEYMQPNSPRFDGERDFYEQLQTQFAGLE